MDHRVLDILEAQEKDRQRGKKIGATIALMVIVPILIFTIFAIMVVAGA